MCGLGILCLSLSLAVLFKVQELQTRCVSFLEFTYHLLEKAKHEQKQEVYAHEGTD